MGFTGAFAGAMEPVTFVGPPAAGWGLVGCAEGKEPLFIRPPAAAGWGLVGCAGSCEEDGGFLVIGVAGADTCMFASLVVMLGTSAGLRPLPRVDFLSHLWHLPWAFAAAVLLSDSSHNSMSGLRALHLLQGWMCSREWPQSRLVRVYLHILIWAAVCRGE